MNIRRLTPDDAAAFQALRLSGLREEPSSFGSSFEEEKDLPLASVASRLAAAEDSGVFGAFDAGGRLVGVVGLGREGRAKMRHKGMIWGMYVAPQARGSGTGRALLEQALALARSVPGLQSLNLCVNAANGPARRLYESLGFETWGREAGGLQVNGQLHDDLHMALRL